MLSYLPLRERVLKSSSVLQHPQDWKLGPFRPAKYKDWHHDSMVSAMKAVIDKGMSVRWAAEMYGVPKNTLGD